MKKTIAFRRFGRFFAGIACLLAISVLFAGCGKPKTPDESESIDTQITTDAEMRQTSESSADATEPAGTSAPETEPYFDPVPYIMEGTDAPAVITAATYEKQAVDCTFDGPFDFVHRISIPALDSDKPGAKALSAKIFDHYSPHIEELKTDSEGRNLYHISYFSSTLGSMVFLCVQTDGGWQYSEGWHSNSYYYYDAAADCEVSAKEYLAYFGLDADALAKEAALSDAYLRAVDSQNFYYGEVEAEELRGAIAAAASAVPEAYEVTAETVRVWMRTEDGYVDYSFACDIDSASGMPCNPSYAVKASEFSSDASSKGIVFDFSDRTLQSVEASPEICSVIRSAYVTSAYVALICTDALPNPGDYEVWVNGKTVGRGSSQGGGDYYMYCYYIEEYTLFEDLKTVEIVMSAE